MADFFALKVTGGREAIVADLIQETLKNRGLGNSIEDILVPTTKKIKIVNNRKKISNTSILGGYVIIKANINDEICSIINNTDGVYGFIGSNRGLPYPISAKEVDKLLSNVEKINIESEGDEDEPADNFLVGDKVLIIQGMFNSFTGIVDYVDIEKRRLKISIMVFGGSSGMTTLDLSFTQVRKKI